MRILAPIPQQGGSRIPKNQIFLKTEKFIQTQKLKNVQRYAKICDTPFNKKKMCCDFRSLQNKNVQILDNIFPFLFPKDSESLKILVIRLHEEGAKRPLNCTSKSEQTDKHTYEHFDLQKASAHKTLPFKVLRGFGTIHGSLGRRSQKKLDWVGPADHRPSQDQLHFYPIVFVIIKR